MDLETFFSVAVYPAAAWICVGYGGMKLFKRWRKR